MNLNGQTNAKVDEYISALKADTAETVRFLRQVILESDKEIGEQIKWNSPAFYFAGEMPAFDAKEYKRDVVVINLHRGNILLVFPTGARISDKSGIGGKNYPDGRKVVPISGLADARLKAGALQSAVKNLLAGVEKD
ncbi:hypothetical protein GS399_20285 [Pedobacter sp. HMF7647]|uniref:YdhG-like domain-containing protein n=1 Tax=Hufsiella arboris TaxID=2695275 RepID=A0A7K1YFS1_9SPHI|nr:DUF1801 domain-containing protein [Hufsiella arboris]MXV53310.1 hypothetical protein [Hufsiella arboris]